MKLKTSIILCSLAATTTMPAFSDTVWNLYAGAAIGAGAQTIFADGEKHTDTAQSFGVMFGLDIPVFRTEVEYSYLTQRETNAHTGFINAYFKMPSTVVKPYMGLGVGMMFGGRDDEINIRYDTTSAYQGMLGVTLETPALPFDFDVEARVIYVPNIYNLNNTEPDILHYGVRVKARYMF